MNLAKKTHINELFGFYEKLLTDKQQAYLRYYFEDDYSIVEIAEAETVSRQAVSDNINRAIEQLEKYESILHLQVDFAKRQALEKDVEQYIETHYPDDNVLKLLVQKLLTTEIDN
ncbi:MULTISPECIES: YlxM family DNA-binding protein [Leuconostoc]|uniref:UPF0122 protein LES8486_00002 n=1 Tax=Leuconostoc suionicum TaxID=1511761 RepID=A0A2N9K6Q0_9LACO|nr:MULTISPECIES: sigma factor-like helix-turn-helix DNA-binding protein [Leuconostoc]API72516.1 DNA-binding protein [Leuconostoc suionicum]MBE4727306.1 DNA-binding protein [Leuconostoc suionicum]MCT4376758.1 DNA-binding protein [Leuconostoc suionicum]MCT4402057.1 DNA-binding protein [Leuconostoc suionicum]MDC2806755.1 sigma factor-like helix-turn-helix DNA-binding protein [Leuconostoc suionicum]